MPICVGCGKQLNENDKFCSECGTQVENSDTEYNVQRKSVYVGVIEKCPSCGAERQNMAAVCPNCGHEFNSLKIHPVLQTFTNSILECEERIAIEEQLDSITHKTRGWSSWGKWPKVAWVFFNILTLAAPLLICWSIRNLFARSSSATPHIKREKSLIENYQVPNEKEVILESLFFIQGKVRALSTQKTTSDNWQWIKLWSTKATQLHDKAQLLFPSERAAEIAYREINALAEKKQKVIKLKRIIMTTCLLIYVLFIVAVSVFFKKGITGIEWSGFVSSIKILFSIILILLFVFIFFKIDENYRGPILIVFVAICVITLMNRSCSQASEKRAVQEELASTFAKQVELIIKEKGMTLTDYDHNTIRGTADINILSSTYDKSAIDEIESSIIALNNDGYNYELDIEIKDTDGLVIKRISTDAYGVASYSVDNTDGFLGYVKSVCNDNGLRITYFYSSMTSHDISVDLRLSSYDEAVINTVQDEIVKAYKDFNYDDLHVDIYDIDKKLVRMFLVDEFQVEYSVNAYEISTQIEQICQKRKVQFTNINSYGDGLSITIVSSSSRRGAINNIENDIISVTNNYELRALYLVIKGTDGNTIRATKVDKSGNVTHTEDNTSLL